MARKPNSTSEQTKKRIVEEASALFSRNGYSGTSIREIANNSTVNVAMVSHYFGGKQGLYDTCIDSLYEEIASQREIIFHAENVATQMTNNAGFNCNAASVLIMQREWPQRRFPWGILPAGPYPWAERLCTARRAPSPCSAPPLPRARRAA